MHAAAAFLSETRAILSNIILLTTHVHTYENAENTNSEKERF